MHNYKIHIAVIAAGLLLTACNREEPQVTVRPVVVEEAHYSESPSSKVYSGYTKAEKVVKASFRVPGHIEELPVFLGQELKKGELIAQLRLEDLKLKLHEAEASYEKAEAESRHATSQYKRVKKLYESESVSRNELDSSRATHEAANAAARRALTLVHIAEQNLSYATLLAERSGCIVSQIFSEVSENVTAGQPIVELVCGNTMEIEISVPESEVGDIEIGNRVMVRFESLEGLLQDGEIVEIGYKSAVGTTFPVTVSLDNVNEKIRPGMAVKVFVEEPENERRDYIVLPIDVVNEDEQGRFVYLFDEEKNGVGTAKKHYIEIAEVSPHGIEIASGLKPGDRYISAGLRFVHDGLKVRLLERGR